MLFKFTLLKGNLSKDVQSTTVAASIIEYYYYY